MLILNIDLMNDSLCDQIHEYIEDNQCIRKCFLSKHCNEEYLNILIVRKRNVNKKYVY